MRSRSCGSQKKEEEVEVEVTSRKSHPLHILFIATGKNVAQLICVQQIVINSRYIVVVAPSPAPLLPLPVPAQTLVT